MAEPGHNATVRYLLKGTSRRPKPLFMSAISLSTRLETFSDVGHNQLLPEWL